MFIYLPTSIIYIYNMLYITTLTYHLTTPHYSQSLWGALTAYAAAQERALRRRVALTGQSMITGVGLEEFPSLGGAMRGEGREEVRGGRGGGYSSGGGGRRGQPNDMSLLSHVTLTWYHYQYTA